MQNQTETDVTSSKIGHRRDSMDEFGYADRYLVDFKVRGNEIVAKYCPICGGGRSRDKHTFYLNYDKHTYKCHRGSCGASGTFKDLCESRGEKANYMEQYKRQFEMSKPKKVYKKPKTQVEAIKSVAAEYASIRGISENTLNHFGVGCDARGNIIFPYYNEKGEHELNKFRVARKYVKGKDTGMKVWQDGEGRPILFGMHKADVKKPLVIIEGEFDCLAVYESGYSNVVSIPFGVENNEWIDECWMWLEQFNEFILWYDNDDAGRKGLNEVVRRLGKARCRIVRCEHKDANIALIREGKEHLLECIKSAEFIPIDHLVKMSEVEEDERDGMLYGIRFIDYKIGACVYGDLVIWTGKRGGAKSTILQQTIAEGIEAGNKIFVYSAELKNGKARRWLERQMVKSDHLAISVNKLTGREDIMVRPAIARVLREWYDESLFTYGDKGGNNEDELFEIMEYAFKRYGIKRFIIDNLKTIRFKGNKDIYRQQADFTQRCKDFCNTNNVHIDLVVHPKKTGEKDEMDDEDVGGSSDIIDLADAVIECKKVPAHKVPEQAQKLGVPYQTNNEDDIRYLTRLKILKNREYGDTGGTAYYKFNIDNKRIEGATGWDKEYSYMKTIREITAEGYQQTKVNEISSDKFNIDDYL